MNPTVRVALPPSRPVLIFDGDCNFCRFWIRRWQRITGEQVEFVPYQAPAVADRFPELSRDALTQAVHFVEANGSVRRGAEAVFHALALGSTWPLWIYEHVPGAAPISEAAYRFVARHRGFFSFLTRALWGRDPEPPSFFLVRWLFLRALGLIYLVAFISLGSQILGLVGSQGIVPAEQTMRAAAQAVEAHQVAYEPTLCWLGTSDRFLKAQCTAGIVLAVLVTAGIAQAPCLLLLWVLYLSLTIVGNVFLGFQWDSLLLETGLLAVAFAPVRLWSDLRRELPPSRLALWLLRWLLFRLMFTSGCVKLLSGDKTWHDLTALTFHYETQPLPTWVGWYAHQLPVWFQKASCAAMFGIEVGIPFAIGFPRRIRFVACACFVLLQLAIMVTGNYTFFNYLALALCLTLLDDAVLARFFPQFMQLRLGEALRRLQTHPRTGLRWARGLLVAPGALVVLVLSSTEVLGMFRLPVPWVSLAEPLYPWVAPLRSVNSYGLFAIMTTSRPEIVIEGSRDGQHWSAYEFKDKPGDLKRAPRFIAPHQPRLDWQMWFAALGDVRQNPWLVNFCVRLLQGAPEVAALLRENPFPDAPPKYVRAVLYDYEFTTASLRGADGAWWRRTSKGVYCPPITLRGGQPALASPP